MRAYRGSLLAIVCAVLLLIEPVVLARSTLWSSITEQPQPDEQHNHNLTIHLLVTLPSTLGSSAEYVQSHRAGMQALLDRTLASLLDSPRRTFVLADLAFAAKWWQELHPDTQQAVRQLAQTGRLEFTNGGIVQHDSAVCHYSSMVDQMSLGVRFLQQQLGLQQPRVAWQLGGVAHSATEPLLKAQGGFEALFLGRSDSREAAQRAANGSLDFVWRGSAAFGPESDLLVMQQPAAAFDARATPAIHSWLWPAAAAAAAAAGAVPDRAQMVTEFVRQARRQQQQHHGSSHVALIVGDDPAAAAAASRGWFSRLEQLMHRVNEDGRVSVSYSTPSRYIAARKAAAEAAAAGWPLKQGDLLPYIVDSVGVSEAWTGYFSSRPGLKGMARQAAALLQATRQVEVLAGLQPSSQALATTRGLSATGNFSLMAVARSEVVRLGRSLAPDADTAVLEFALALAQRPGQAAGSHALDTANDLASWLQVGAEKSAQKLLAGLQQLVFSEWKPPAAGLAASLAGAPWFRQLSTMVVHSSSGSGSGSGSSSSGVRPFTSLVAPGRVTAPAMAATGAPELHMCLLLNVSLCEASVELSKAGDGFLLVVYNPLPFAYEWGVRVPVAEGSFAVTDPGGAPVPVQRLSMPTASYVVWTGTRATVAGLSPEQDAKTELAMLVKAPALGHAVYMVRRVAPDEDATSASQVEHLNGKDRTLSSGPLQLLVDQASHGISQVTVHGRRFLFQQALFSHSRPRSAPAAGARPYATTSTAAAPAAKQGVEIVLGPVVQEVREIYPGLGTLVTRLWKGRDTLEMEWTLAVPQHTHDWEAFVRYTTPIESGGRFLTDANGREWQQRRRGGHAQPHQGHAGARARPAAADVYPMTSGCGIRDEKSSLFVATDRTQGVTSPTDGQLDIFLHGTASVLPSGAPAGRQLQDPTVALGRHLISFGTRKPVAWQWRQQRRGAGPGQHMHMRHCQAILNDPLQLAFSSIPRSYRPAFSGLVQPDKPPGAVHILTLKWVSCSTALLRLSHVFQAGEHQELSQPAEVRLGELFGLPIIGATEASLFGEAPLTAADGSRPTFNISRHLDPQWEPPLAAAASASPADGATAGRHSFTSNRITGLIQADDVITLEPMQIRTFLVSVHHSHGSCHTTTTQEGLRGQQHPAYQQQADLGPAGRAAAAGTSAATAAAAAHGLPGDAADGVSGRLPVAVVLPLLAGLMIAVRLHCSLSGPKVKQ